MRFSVIAQLKEHDRHICFAFCPLFLPTQNLISTSYNNDDKINYSCVIILQNELKKKIQKIQDREKGMKKELSDVKTENQWLVNNQKSGSPNKKSEDSVKQTEAMRNELKEEKDKVKNLTVWKSQLSEKNKELKEENAKLFVMLLPQYLTKVVYFDSKICY